MKTPPNSDKTREGSSLRRMVSLRLRLSAENAETIASLLDCDGSCSDDPKLSKLALSVARRISDQIREQTNAPAQRPGESL